MKHLGIQAISAFLGGAFVMALQGPAQSPRIQEAQAIPTCAKTIEDVSTGNCISADSTPTLGRLYPMSPDLNVDLAGNVGVGTTVPTAKLDVAGGANISGPVGVGTTEPQCDLQVLGDSASSFRVGRVPGAFAASAEITADAEAVSLTLASPVAYYSNANLVFGTEYGPEVVFNLHPDDSTFGITYGPDYMLGMSTNIYTTTGVGPQVTVGARAVNPGSSGLEFNLVGSASLRVYGDVAQPLDGGGLVKAGCHIDGTSNPPTVSRSFCDLPLGAPYQGYATQVLRTSTGVYSVSFDNPYYGYVADLSTRFFQATLGGATDAPVPLGFVRVHPGTNSVIVETFDVTGTPADNQFYLAVY